MVPTTRPMSWRTLVSRWGVAEVAAEVLGGDDVGGQLGPAGGELDAVLLEDALPPSPWMVASRVSHSTVENGSTPCVDNRR